MDFSTSACMMKKTVEGVDVGRRYSALIGAEKVWCASSYSRYHGSSCHASGADCHAPFCWNREPLPLWMEPTK